MLHHASLKYQKAMCKDPLKTIGPNCCGDPHKLEDDIGFLPYPYVFLLQKYRID